MEWTNPGDQVPRYSTCIDCGRTTIGSTSYRNRSQASRDELRAQGIERRIGDRCRNCYTRELRRSQATATVYTGLRVRLTTEELLDEWRHFADPNLTVAENCRRLAPRLGMRWRSMERAINRARERAAA